MSTWILVVNAVALAVLATVIIVVVIRLSRMEARIAAMDPVKPFWAALQTKLVSDLLHPSPQFQEMDDLMRQLEALTITPEGRVRLTELLQERAVSTDKEVAASEPGSARILLEAMDKVLEEAENTSPVINAQLVGTKATEAAKEEKA